MIISHFNRYFEGKVLPQIKELLTNYGEVVELWCDCPLDIEKKYSEKLRDVVHELRPGCRINSRIGNDCGDFDSLGDNQIMTFRQSRPCESPITLNHTWGFKFDDEDWKSSSLIAERMASLASRDANLLVNVGPRPDGALPDGTIRILRELAGWKQSLPENVLAGSGPSRFAQNFDWGYSTTTGNVLNLFLKKTDRPVEISGIRNRVRSADVPFTQNGESLTLQVQDLPASLLPLARVTLDGEPDITPGFLPQNGVLILTPADGRISAENDSADAAGIFGVDGVRIAGSSHMSVARDGTLASWHNPADRISWQVAFPSGGNFRVEIVSFMPFHARPWVGDRDVEVFMNDLPLIGHRLLPDRLLEGGPHPVMASSLGVVTFPPDTRGIVSLRTSGIFSDAARIINLVELRFVKVKD
mgnify:CR=1 FL=1